MRKFWLSLATLLLGASLALGQNLTLGVGSNNDVSDFVPGDQSCLAVSGTTQTFTLNTKGGGNNRIVVFSVSWVDTTAAGTAELSSGTYAGSALTRATRALGDNQNSNAEIWYVFSNATSGDLVLNFSTAVNRVTVQSYRLIRFAQQGPAGTIVGTTSVGIGTVTNGAAIAVGTRSDASSTTLSNLTQDYSASCGSGQWGVHSSSYPTGTGTITSTISPTTNTPLIAAAFWQPTALPTLTFRGRCIDTASCSIDIGSDSNQFVVAVVVHRRGSVPGRTITSLSMGGTNGTIVTQAGADATTGVGGGIVTRTIASGGSQTFTATYSGALTCSEILVYTVAGLNSTTAVDSASTISPSSTPAEALLDTTVGGVLIAGSFSQSDSGTITWTGINTIPINTVCTGTPYSTAYTVGTGTETNHSVTSVGPGTVVGTVTTAASWR